MVRILPGEANLKSGRFSSRSSLRPLRQLARKCQHVKWLAVFRRQDAGLPIAVREQETQESPFFRGFLPFETGRARGGPTTNTLFGTVTSTGTPRIMQGSLRFTF